MLLDNADVTLDVFNSAPLYAKAMAAGGWGSSIVCDGKLAAYLLDASASKYQISELIPAYKAAAAFTCTDYADAGRLADLFASGNSISLYSASSPQAVISAFIRANRSARRPASGSSVQVKAAAAL